MTYDHRVMAIFNPGDATGFMYTVGMPHQELFALNVPRGCANEVCSTINFLSRRLLSENDGVQSGDFSFHLRGLEGRTPLMKTHLVQMDPSAEVLELCPIFGWPERSVDPCQGFGCSCCKCVECGS